MTKRTRDALERLADGVEMLLTALNKEPSLLIDYTRMVPLKKSCKELKDALNHEPVGNK